MARNQFIYHYFDVQLCYKRGERRKDPIDVFSILVIKMGQEKVLPWINNPLIVKVTDYMTDWQQRHVTDNNLPNHIYIIRRKVIVAEDRTSGMITIAITHPRDEDNHTFSKAKGRMIAEGRLDLLLSGGRRKKKDVKNNGTYG